MKHSSKSKNALCILLSAATISTLSVSNLPFANAISTSESSVKINGSDPQFTQENGLIFEENNGEITIIGGENLPEYLFIPLEVNGLPVTAIADSAFQGNSELRYVTLSTSVRTIGSSAFAGSTVLAVSMPTGITEIGDYAFSNCEYLNHVGIPSTVNELHANTFAGTQLDYCTIENPDCIIPDDMVFPENITIEGKENSTAQVFAEKAGFNFDALLDADTAYDATTAPYDNYTTTTTTTCNTGLFHSNDPNTATLDNGLIYTKHDGYVSVGGGGDMPWAMEVNGDLEIPETLEGLPVTKIESWAFEFNHTIENVILPSTVTSIENNAFERCSLQSINLPEGLTEIGDYAFSKCWKLPSIVIPSTVKSIKQNTFFDTALTSCYFLNPDCEIPEWTQFPQEMVVFGFEGSTAQAFAEATGRTFVAITEEEAEQLKKDNSKSYEQTAVTTTIPATTAVTTTTTVMSTYLNTSSEETQAPTTTTTAGITTSNAPQTTDVLPQTGIHSLQQLLIAAGALLLTCGGAAIVWFSGILRRREHED